MKSDLSYNCLGFVYHISRIYFTGCFCFTFDIYPQSYNIKNSTRYEKLLVMTILLYISNFYLMFWLCNNCDAINIKTFYFEKQIKLFNSCNSVLISHSQIAFHSSNANTIWLFTRASTILLQHKATCLSF